MANRPPQEASKNIQLQMLSIINVVGESCNAARGELSTSFRHMKYICRHLFRKADGSLPGHPDLSAWKGISGSPEGSGIKRVSRLCFWKTAVRSDGSVQSVSAGHASGTGG